MLHHADTGTRGSNNRRIAFRKGVHEVQCHRTRFILEAVIEKRLTTTSLLRRENQFHAQALQDKSHILKGGRVKLVAKTGKKKLGFWHNRLSQKRFVQTTVHTDDLSGCFAEFTAAQ